MKKTMQLSTRFASACCVLAVAHGASAQSAPSCTRLALALVIDRSGSMTGQSIDNAKAAAAATVDKLTTSDCVTVIAFDARPTTIVPLHALNDAAAVKTAIATIQAAGGTEILSALDAASKALHAATSAQKKHVILLTDGQSPTAGMQQLAQAMSTSHTTITTVGLGSGVDEQTLRMLSNTGNGRYYHVGDVTALTRVFTREVEVTLGP